MRISRDVTLTDLVFPRRVGSSVLSVSFSEGFSRPFQVMYGSREAITRLCSEQYLPWKSKGINVSFDEVTFAQWREDVRGNWWLTDGFILLVTIIPPGRLGMSLVTNPLDLEHLWLVS